MGAAVALGASLLPGVLGPTASAAPVGQGFALNASDLKFILQQITISESHAANTTAETGLCGALIDRDDPSTPEDDDGIDDAGQLPGDGNVGQTLPLGLRTVDGTCNNIVADQEAFGAADQDFRRLVPKDFRPGYDQTGNVTDPQPRVISNLIVDQTADNPAAAEAAGVPPGGSEVLFIPNVAPDVGLSAPYNSWFTLFGQFFDHGLDLVNKGGNGTVTIPLQPDDPLFGQGAPFMTLTRATHAGDLEATNQTSPWVDQSQTYGSHPSHNAFLREYELVGGQPVGTGRMVTGTGDGMADWAGVKAQAETVLGIRLADQDVVSIPTLLTDQYGHFVRGPLRGMPQLVLDDGTLREGDAAAPVGTAGARPSGHAFLIDIAHTAVPSGTKTPDTDTVLNSRNAPPSATTYDDEMLDAHFMAGDGRVNENAGLIAVHHVFHSEHNRLTEDIKGMVETDPSVTAAERAAWQAVGPAGWDYGERLFQAARFVTEMEYQHLAFEEFARKVQPMVNAFGEGGTGYRSDINAAISAEFAHAVYRFGHSMLTETVDRVDAAGTPRSIPLLEAFLNPPAFLGTGTDPRAAAGDVVRGMTGQVGNELDEFVTEALRNQLLGLPLDLATLNLARARDTGIPGLNAARRAFFAETSDTSLQPYTSWADLSFSLKHEASLVNFIAAYGTHPTITAQTAVAARRAAAQELLDLAGSPPPPPATTPEEEAAAADLLARQQDALAFLNSTDSHASTPAGITTTGVDAIDLWVGGLAEKQIVFGGLLGPTFNHVFERQMENLQDGDRFYYLSRTAGLNLLTQLEGNSFAELIQRNTDVEGLPADSFSRPGLVFDLEVQAATGAIVDDPATEYDERVLLVREPDGTIRYGGGEHVVFNGAPRADRVRSSEGDDTVRGNVGDDRMEGGDGNDNLIGGDGDDILTDLGGDDTLKGGNGNDALSSGRGFGADLNQGGLGKDFIVGGNDTTETFGGPGDDFIFAGDAEDTVFGDDGDDWIEGGQGPFNLLQGDNGAPFQDDPNEPGHDVLFSYGGEQDFDAEGGDDIMLVGPGIQRSEGMLGFDCTSHKNDPQAGNSDMRLTGLLPPSVETNRDRFDLVECLSGWRFDDVLRGDDRAATDMVGHELDAAGIARVAGLVGLLPAGATGFTGGNVLMGGAGSDVIEGRGGDDLIDGDAWLDVELEVRTSDGTPVRRVDSMAGLRAEVFAGTLNPGNIHIARTVRPTDPGTAVDVAVFSGPRADYDFVVGADGTTLTVVHARGTGVDGTDVLRGVERLRFGGFAAPPGQDVAVAGILNNSPATGTVALSTTTPAQGQAVTATPTLADADGLGPVTVTFQRGDAATPTVFTDVASGTTYIPTADDVGSPLRAVASFVDGLGNTERVVSAPTAPVVEVTVTVPGAPTIGVASAGDGTATVTWTPPANNGGLPVDTYRIRVIRGGNATGGGNDSGATTEPAVLPGTATSAVVTGLANGTTYRFTVAAVNDAGVGLPSARSNTVTPSAAAAPPTTGPDVTSPTVTARSPEPNAVNANRNRGVTATFSEDVTGVSATTFRVRAAGSATDVVGVVTYDAATRTASFAPSGRMAARTVHTVTLTVGITDTAGNRLPQTAWSFTTN